MDNTRKDQDPAGGAPPEGTGFGEPGRDELLQSNSPAVPSPTKTGQERLTTPQGRITSLGETPADANPALNETIGEETGQTSTADFLSAREDAEEDYMRRRQAEVYADAGPDKISRDFSRTDTGQPDYPYKYEGDDTARSLDNVDISEDFEGMTQGIGGMDLRARSEALMDRDGPETVYTEAMQGRGPVGGRAKELDISEPSMPDLEPPNEMRDIAPDMKNIPTEE